MLYRFEVNKNLTEMIRYEGIGGGNLKKQMENTNSWNLLNIDLQNKYILVYYKKQVDRGSHTVYIPSYIKNLA